MKIKPAANREGWHLLAVKAGVYAGVVLLFVIPLAGHSGAVIALAVLPVALLLSHWLARARARLPLLVGAGLGLAVLGLNVPGLIGSQGWFVRWLGLQAARPGWKA